MTFGYRLKLYGFGFLIGILILMIVLKGKKCSSPYEMKMEELRMQSMTFSEKAKCQLGCIGITEEQFKKALGAYRINYDMSEIHTKPCGKFFVEPIKNDTSKASVLIEDCDSISNVV